MTTLIHTVRCPVCGSLPAIALSPAQAFCGNNECSGFAYALTVPVVDQLSAPNYHHPDGTTRSGPSLLSPDAPTETVFKAKPAPTEEEQVIDAHAEALFRADLHDQGCRCASDCPICDQALPYTKAQEAIFYITVFALANDPGPMVADGLIRDIRGMFGDRGLLYLRDLVDAFNG